MKRWDQSRVPSASYASHGRVDANDAAYFALDCLGTQCCFDGSGMHELTSDNSSNIRSHRSRLTLFSFHCRITDGWIRWMF